MGEEEYYVYGKFEEKESKSLRDKLKKRRRFRNGKRLKKALKRGVKKTGVVMARGTKILAKRTGGAIKTGVKKTVTKENIRKTIKTIGKGIEGMALPPSETGKRKRQPMFGFETSPIGLDMKPPEVDLPSADFYFGSPKQVRKIRRHRRKTKRKKHRKKSRSKSRRKRKVVIYI